MIRTTLVLGLSILTSEAGWAQTLGPPNAQNPPTAQNMLAASLADLRGVVESVEGPATEKRNDWATLWFSVVAGPSGPPDTSRVPGPVGSPAGMVSATHLRHQVPKAARQAYQKAARTQDARKAVKDLENAVKIDPDFAEAHADLGVAYSRLEMYPEAVSELQRAVELIPGEPILYANLAWVLFEMGQRAEAEGNVRRALQLSPNNAAAHLLMGRLLIETPQTFAEGLWHLEYAAKTMPEAKKLTKLLAENRRK
jgi:tetratricopeptide (TPR) repeat protein